MSKLKTETPSQSQSQTNQKQLRPPPVGWSSPPVGRKPLLSLCFWRASPCPLFSFSFFLSCNEWFSGLSPPLALTSLRTWEHVLDVLHPYSSHPSVCVVISILKKSYLDCQVNFWCKRPQWILFKRTGWEEGWMGKRRRNESCSKWSSPNADERP